MPEPVIRSTYSPPCSSFTQILWSKKGNIEFTDPLPVCPMLPILFKEVAWGRHKILGMGQMLPFNPLIFYEREETWGTPSMTWWKMKPATPSTLLLNMSRIIHIMDRLILIHTSISLIPLLNGRGQIVASCNLWATGHWSRVFFLARQRDTCSVQLLLSGWQIQSGQASLSLTHDSAWTQARQVALVLLTNGRDKIII